MVFSKSFIPYGMYWSTPFCKWQGSFAHLHPIPFAADVAKGAMAKRNLDPKALDSIVCGITIPQKHIFYGGPWVASLLGAEHITGPMIGQACSTGAKCVELASYEVEMENSGTVLVLTTDKTSNGPHMYFPQPHAPGATGDSENWVWDNFGYDPWAKNAMIQTAENVAKEAGISKEEQDEVALLRYQQYQDALKDDAAFLRRYMDLPMEVKDAKGRKVLKTLEGDEGVFPSTPEGLAKLRPMLPEGTVTFGSQTFPADGNASLVVSTRDRAQELSTDKNIEVQVISFAQANTKKGFMAMAIVPAAKKALERAGIGIKDLKVIKTHNPFAVNDVYMARELGLKAEDVNNYGSSLVWGHPQGSTATRLIIEVIEELALKGGGYGMFDGCAAGDTGAALILKVDVRS
jgi:acetyl-CoA acetyltransferase family protein